MFRIFDILKKLTILYHFVTLSNDPRTSVLTIFIDVRLGMSHEH